MHCGLEAFQVQPRIQQSILLPSSYGDDAVTDAKDSTASTPSITQKYFIIPLPCFLWDGARSRDDSPEPEMVALGA